MATDPRALPSDKTVRRLLALYTEAQRELAAQVRAALLAGNLDTARRRAMQLAAAQDVLDQLGYRADPLARQAVLEASLDGASMAADGIRKIGVTLTPAGERSFAAVNAQAVATMQDSIVASLQGARSTVGRQIGDLYAREQRRQAMRALLGAEGSPQAARRRLAQRLASRGATGFVDKAGRRWALSDYSDMAVRTVTREAVVQGSVARMAAHGIQLARVSQHASSCDICKPYEGRLLDLAGNTTDFEGEPVMDASTLPPFHPRCRHTIQPVAARVERVRRELAAQGADGA